MKQIAILITLCSKNQSWKELCDCDLISITLDSILSTTSNSPHKLKFYIGFDENDDFFINYYDTLKKRYPKFNITIFPKTTNGDPCEAWNLLLKEAIIDKENDYYYQLGSDIKHLTNHWDTYFINLMKKHDDDIVCGGIDQSFWIERLIRDQAGILENVFFSRKHFNRFGFLFPPEVKTWYSDDLITKIYRNVDKCYICPNIKYINTNRVSGNNEKSRYIPPEKELIAKNWSKIANNYTKKGFNLEEKDLIVLNSINVYN